jgi:ArsR family transcriptional regulator, arsenate/arsenite/antimonite-responsive transcriptional repressor / arsenate reductase (thioredoxin)
VILYSMWTGLGQPGNISEVIETIGFDRNEGPMDTGSPSPKPPTFLKLLAHVVRWRLLEALARSDHTVQELVAIVDRPDNLVSYHLGRLRDYHIVSERRGDADGRDVYYSLDVEHLRDLFFAAGRALPPALGIGLGELGDKPLAEPASRTPARVLFICTNNSARSQMAEALLRDLGRGQVEVLSGGTEPSEVRPEAVWAMAQMGLDIGAQRSKGLDQFLNRRFDYVITVCDRAKEVCPMFPGDVSRIHWSFPDPAKVEGAEDARRRAFQTTAMELLTRIRLFIIVMERDRRERQERESRPISQAALSGSPVCRPPAPG